MDRRQVLAGLAAGFPLGSGCLGLFDSDGTEMSATDRTEANPSSAPGTPPKTRTETGQTPTTRHSQSGGTPDGSMPIDTAHLATYTSDTASYSIKYPASWRVTVSNPSDVRFISPISPAFMLVRVKDSVPSIVPRETIIEAAFRRARRAYSLDRFTRVGQRDATLSNGTPATVIDTRLSRSSSDTMLRGKFLVAHVSNTVYMDGILVSERAYNRSVDRAMNTIATSLTIRGATTAARE